MSTILSWRNQRLLFALILVSAICSLLFPALVNAYAGLGGYISEKMLGSGTSASLYLGSGTSGPVVLGRGPAVTTNPVSGAAISGGTTTATLNGNLDSLAGFPLAQVQFEWGYDPATLTNTTTLTNVAVTGAYSAVITGYNPSVEVYYRAVGYTDGVVRGSVTHFHATGGEGAGFWVMRHLLSLAIGIGVFVVVVVVLARGGNWVAMLIAALIGIATIAFVNNILGSMFGG